MDFRKKIFFSILFFAGCVLRIFWAPLADRLGSIQWDAVNVHFFNLQFSSNAWHSGIFPLWTPYIFGGFPQIADLQVAFFYPINLAISYFAVFTPEIMLYQAILHYFLAGFFAFLLVLYLSKRFLFSLSAGVVYSFGGFMAGHASHIGMQNAAAWLPLIFLLVLLALNRNKIIYSIWGGVALGIAILAGHFQIALYISFAAGLYFIFDILWESFKNFKSGKTINILRAVLRKTVFAGAFFVFAFLIASVQLLPTSELVQKSQRAQLSLEMSQTESLSPQTLRNFFDPNYNNVLSGEYAGPWDRTQNYIFLSRIFIILAALGAIMGLRSKTGRKITVFWIALLLVSLFYSFGGYGFLQKYFYLYVPFFDKIRAPANMMILFNLSVLGLASGAALEIGKFFEKLGKEKWVRLQIGKVDNPKVFKCVKIIFESAVLIAVVWEILLPNLSNVLLYARANASDIIKPPPMADLVLTDYSYLEENEKFKIFRLPGLETNASQIFRIYAFDGYNPLSLARYGRYVDEMVKNEKLVDLAGIKYLPCRFIASRAGQMEKINDICVNNNYFNQAFFTEKYLIVQTEEEALNNLSSIELSETAVIEEADKNDLFPIAPEDQLLSGEQKKDLEIIEAGPGFWKMRAETSKDSFLILTQTNYPGWSARIDGVSAKIYQADYLFQAVYVPAGSHEIIFSFKSRQLKFGAILSIIGILFAAAFSAYEISKNKKIFPIN